MLAPGGRANVGHRNVCVESKRLDACLAEPPATADGHGVAAVRSKDGNGLEQQGGL